MPLYPASVATGFVAFTTTQPGGVLVPQRTMVQAGSVPFETTVEATAWPISAHAVGRLQRGAPNPGEETEFATRAWDAHLQTASAGDDEEPVYYAVQVLGDDPTVLLQLGNRRPESATGDERVNGGGTACVVERA